MRGLLKNFYRLFFISHDFLFSISLHLLFISNILKKNLDDLVIHFFLKNNKMQKSDSVCISIKIGN